MRRSANIYVENYAILGHPVAFIDYDCYEMEFVLASSL
jgi:hypothetical protein